MGPPVHSNDILVLIQPAQAGPAVDSDSYWQPQWVLWPPDVAAGDGGRLLSIATGANWVGDPADFGFVALDRGQAWRSADFEKQRNVGRFAVRSAMYGGLRTDLLVGKSGSASRNGLRLALNGDSPVVKPFRIDDRNWPAGSLMVAEASGWDEVAQLKASTVGRVLVVEYPPKQDTPWSRYWLMGHGWQIGGVGLTATAENAVVPMQADLPVPGLIRARMLVPLVEHPGRFRTAEVTPRDWPGASRFLETSQADGFYLGAGWIAACVGAVIWAAVLIANERESKVLPALLNAVMLSPAIVALAGVLERDLGVQEWPVWLALSAVTLVAATLGLGAGIRRWAPRSHPLLSLCVVGLIVLAVADPLWGFLSPVFGGGSLTVSPIALGAMCAYLGALVAFLRGAGKLVWLGRLACLMFLLGGAWMRAWWLGDLGAALFVPTACLIVGEGWFQKPMLVAFLLWPASLFVLVTGGFVWAPLGLLKDAQGRSGINLALYSDFLLSPSLVVALALTGAIALFGFKFFFHQLRTLVKIDRRRNALPWLAACGGAFGLLHPAFLPAAVVLGVGAALALMCDAVQTM